jgi:hypothetical protein
MRALHPRHLVVHVQTPNRIGAQCDSTIGVDAVGTDYSMAAHVFPTWSVSG